CSCSVKSVSAQRATGSPPSWFFWGPGFQVSSSWQQMPGCSILSGIVWARERNHPQQLLGPDTQSMGWMAIPTHDDWVRCYSLLCDGSGWRILSAQRKTRSFWPDFLEAFRAHRTPVFNPHGLSDRRWPGEEYRQTSTSNLGSHG